jgi:hypothetical protein
VLTNAVRTFFSKYSMIQVHNTSKLYKEFHKISSDTLQGVDGIICKGRMVRVEAKLPPVTQATQVRN